MTEPELSIIRPLSCCLLATMKIKGNSIENTLTMFFLQESINIMEGNSGKWDKPKFLIFLMNRSLLYFLLTKFTTQTEYLTNKKL